MAVTTKYNLYAIDIDGTVLGGIKDDRLELDPEVRAEPHDGEVYARQANLYAQAPRASWSCIDIAQAFNDLGGTNETDRLHGLDISGLTAGLDFWAQQAKSGGTREGTLKHRKYRAVQGMVIHEALQARHNDDATLSSRAEITYDGTNDPIVITELQSLPALPTGVDRYTIGPITVAGLTIDHVREVTVNFNVRSQREGSDSEIWDQFVNIEQIAPEIIIRGIDIEWLKAATIPIDGKAFLHTNTKIYFKRRAVGGTFIADNVANHVKITASGMAIVDTGFDRREAGAAEASLRLICNYEESTSKNALEIFLAQTIT